MTMKFSTSVRNARLNAIQTVAGVSPILLIYNGVLPGSCSEPATGNALVAINLPATWMQDASNGSKEKNGVWETLSATTSGTASYFRIYDNQEIACHLQGTVTGTGGNGDLILDNTEIVQGQSVSINSFVLSDGNA